MIGVAMARRERGCQRPTRSAGAQTRPRRRRNRKARRSPADSVFRLLFVDLLARFRSEHGLPPISPARMARMSDDELFEAVRAVRATRDAKIGTGIKKRFERDSRARRRSNGGS